MAGPEEPIQVSAEGLDAMRAELNELNAESVIVTEQMKRAAADKDFRRSAASGRARAESHIEGRIQGTRSHTRRAPTTVNRADPRDGGVLGDTVHLSTLILAAADSITYTLVDSREASPREADCLRPSPIGRGHHGQARGPGGAVHCPGGHLTYRIEEIKPHQQ
jgi:transcription elongation GreA/GreB family factor